MLNIEKVTEIVAWVVNRKPLCVGKVFLNLLPHFLLLITKKGRKLWLEDQAMKSDVQQTSNNSQKPVYFCVMRNTEKGDGGNNYLSSSDEL